MIFFVIFGAMLGAALGSFACCQAWRIRLKATGKKNPGKRSVCLSCGEKLRWFENIPVVSWVVQKGKCRHCGKEIGKAEILSEVAGAVGFGMIGWKFGQEYLWIAENCGTGIDCCCGGAVRMWFLIGKVVNVVIFTTLLLILAIYDAKWREMPVGILVAAVVAGGVLAVLSITDYTTDVWSLVGGVGLLAGTYYILYIVSREKLVGGGDWILCLAIAFGLSSWWLALVELFLANFIGCVVMLPQKKKRIAFGPFLVIGFVIIFTFADEIVKLLY